MSFRKIGRLLGIPHQSVINRVHHDEATRPAVALPAHVGVIEMDELYGRTVYLVESVNADLRCCLARLVRRSRCFTRSLEGLRGAVRLFQCAYNRRQLLRNEKKLKNVPGLCDCLPVSV